MHVMTPVRTLSALPDEGSIYTENLIFSGRDE